MFCTRVVPLTVHGMYVRHADWEAWPGCMPSTGEQVLVVVFFIAATRIRAYVHLISQSTYRTCVIDSSRCRLGDCTVMLRPVQLERCCIYC